jgi:hypothetical protein
MSLTAFDRDQNVEDEKRMYTYRNRPKVMAGIPAPSIYKYKVEAAKAKSVSNFSQAPQEFKPNVSNAFFASGIIPLDYQQNLGPHRRNVSTAMDRPPTMVAKEIRHMAGATP